MIERIARVGSVADGKLVYDLFRVERQGFLSIVTFRLHGKSYELMDRGDAVVVLPVDSARRELYLLREERPLKAFLDGAGRDWLAKVRRDGWTSPGEAFETEAAAIEIFEIVAGGIELDARTRLPKETPKEAALRELEEEAGFVIGPERLHPLPPYCTTLGGCTERIFPFFADVSGPVVRVAPEGDGGERLDVLRMSWDDAFGILDGGGVETASLNFLLLKLQNLDLKGSFVDGRVADRQG